MPYLKIDSCVDCPHHGIDNSVAQDMDDMFGIFCNHKDQENKEVFLAKIKNKDFSIYFNCPLYNEQSESL